MNQKWTLRNLCLTLVVVLGVTLALAGCANDGTTVPSTFVEPTTQPTTAPTDPAPTDPTPEEPERDLVKEYEAYIAMTPAEQQAFFDTFDSYADFFTWYHEAMEAYEESQNRIEVGDGEINIGDLIEGIK